MRVRNFLSQQPGITAVHYRRLKKGVITSAISFPPFKMLFVLFELSCGSGGGHLHEFRIKCDF